jgi:ankyrin repeat protein
MDIWKIIMNNEIDKLKEFIFYGGNVDTKYYDTLLMSCVSFPRLKMLKILLKNGADVNLQNEDGQTATIYASMFGEYKILKLLLKHKADITIKDKEGKTALDYAKEYYDNNYRYKKIIKLLKKVGKK